MRRLTSALLAVAAGLAAGSCHRTIAPELLGEWQSRTYYTCCNIHYEGPRIKNANYSAGSVLPFGSPVTIVAMTDDSATFRSAGIELTLEHSIGREHESPQQYFRKVFLDTDPRAVFATYPRAVQDAISEARVERGMTKEQVIMSLGYPPTHRTASLALDEWIYWYNRRTAYQVRFGADGTVTNVVGSNAPTDNRSVIVATPTPGSSSLDRGRPD